MTIANVARASTRPYTIAERWPLRAGPVVVGAGGDESATVLRAGTLVAEWVGRETTVVSAVDPLRQYGWQPGSGRYPVRAADALIGASRTEVARELLAAGLSWPRSVVIEPGSAPAVITRAAREAKGAMIVLGIGRHRPLDRLLGAETALHTVRQADCPVLAVPRSFVARPSAVVVGVDFSNACRHAVECMLPVIHERATVHLVHVWQPFDIAEEWYMKQDDAYRRELPARFKSLIESLALPATMRVKTEAREGNTAERLLDFAAAHHGELIVVGRHGRDVVERLLVGSVTTRVLRGAACAVLVAPEPPPQGRVRATDLHGLIGSRYGREQWSAQLDELSRRNAGHLTILELSDADGHLYSREQGYPLFGATYREPSHELEIILGEANGRRRHLTRIISNASSLTLYRDQAGADRAVRIGHDRGEMLLSFMPAAARATASR